MMDEDGAAGPVDDGHRRAAQDEAFDSGTGMSGHRCHGVPITRCVVDQCFGSVMAVQGGVPDGSSQAVL